MLGLGEMSDKEYAFKLYQDLDKVEEREILAKCVKLQDTARRYVKAPTDDIKREAVQVSVLDFAQPQKLCALIQCVNKKGLYLALLRIAHDILKIYLFDGVRLSAHGII